MPLGHVDESPHASRARAVKVGRVVEYLISAHRAPAALCLARDADDEAWAAIAVEADVKPLSPRSRALVIDSLERRAYPSSDPFAGL